MVQFAVADDFTVRGVASHDREKPQLKFKASRNVVVSDKARKIFEGRYAEYTKTAKTFAKRVNEFMEAQEWSPELFATRTGLGQRAYFRITSGETKAPRIETVLSICIGLRLSSYERLELLTLAGYGFMKSEKEFAYHYIFDIYQINSIDDFNRAYLSLGLEAKRTAPLKYSEGYGSNDDEY